MQKAPQKTVTSIIKGLHDSDIEGKYIIFNDIFWKHTITVTMSVLWEVH